MVDELQENKKLKVGATWSLPGGHAAGAQRTAANLGTAAPRLGILGWAQLGTLLGALPG